MCLTVGVFLEESARQKAKSGESEAKNEAKKAIRFLHTTGLAISGLTLKQRGDCRYSGYNGYSGKRRDKANAIWRARRAFRFPPFHFFHSSIPLSILHRKFMAHRSLLC